MMESSNFRVRTGASFLRNNRLALAESQKLARPNREGMSESLQRFKSLPPAVRRHRERWVDANQSAIGVPKKQSALFSPQHWLLSGNPRLAKLVTQTIGTRWMTHVEDLEQLVTLAECPLFQSQWHAVKLANKQALALDLKRSQGIEIDVNSLFDLHLQPIGTHHRQLLTILHIINLGDRLKQYPGSKMVPRTFIFGDLDAVPAPETAVDANLQRSIIALIESLAKIIAADRDLCGKIQVVYIPDAQAWTSKLYAAADVTEQIATATIEDIDLTKMQATINGVIAIGSLGKTNYWLQQLVGEDNCFRFGLAIPEIELFKEYGYDPINYYKHYPQIRQAIDYLLAGYFSASEPSLGRAIVNTLLGADEQMVMADYIFYAACQAQVSATYDRAAQWTQMSIFNVAGVR
ncbi:glycogen/starch/alpha-glucan phosphorylase [Chamaesiphon sp. OTE_8_metabat_110]|uniref:glycogen/starch/alpha-glucan phosphorylase n=1 Tax=Chamaesiphon sp. OTE_8_metabat_110 TaxID=2964696 RepID=UPI00286D1B3C|nr:glycogen/starch/alpha-glucan phosphorylase [Chamaesiphon sp. OTE_8_metabat_110]